MGKRKVQKKKDGAVDKGSGSRAEEVVEDVDANESKGVPKLTDQGQAGLSTLGGADVENGQEGSGSQDEAELESRIHQKDYFEVDAPNHSSSPPVSVSPRPVIAVQSEANLSANVATSHLERAVSTSAVPIHSPIVSIPGQTVSARAFSSPPSQTSKSLGRNFLPCVQPFASDSRVTAKPSSPCPSPRVLPVTFLPNQEQTIEEFTARTPAVVVKSPADVAERSPTSCLSRPTFDGLVGLLEEAYPRPKQPTLSKPNLLSTKPRGHVLPFTPRGGDEKAEEDYASEFNDFSTMPAASPRVPLTSPRPGVSFTNARRSYEHYPVPQHLHHHDYHHYHNLPGSVYHPIFGQRYVKSEMREELDGRRCVQYALRDVGVRVVSSRNDESMAASAGGSQHGNRHARYAAEILSFTSDSQEHNNMEYSSLLHPLCRSIDESSVADHRKHLESVGSREGFAHAADSGAHVLPGRPTPGSVSRIDLSYVSPAYSMELSSLSSCHPQYLSQLVMERPMLSPRYVTELPLQSPRQAPQLVCAGRAMHSPQDFSAGPQALTRPSHHQTQHDNHRWMPRMPTTVGASPYYQEAHRARSHYYHEALLSPREPGAREHMSLRHPAGQPLPSLRVRDGLLDQGFASNAPAAMGTRSSRDAFLNDAYGSFPTTPRGYLERDAYARPGTPRSVNFVLAPHPLGDFPFQRAAPISSTSAVYDHSTDRVSVSMPLNNYLSLFESQPHASRIAGSLMATPSYQLDSPRRITPGSAYNTLVNAPRGF